MNTLGKKHMHMEAFLATPHHVLLRYGLVVALPLVAIWLLVTLLVYGVGPELPRIASAAILLAVLCAAGASLLKIEYRIMSLPGVNHTLPVNFAAATLVSFVILVIMSGLEPSFLGMGRLIQITVLAGPALVLIPALVYDLGYKLVVHRMVMRTTTIDFNYLVGSRQLEEQLVGLWEGPQEFGEPLSLLLLQFRPQERSISPAAPDGSHHHPEIVEQALSIVEQNIRQKDIAGQFSSDSIWVVLGRTGADDVAIPQARIRNRVSKDPELATAMKRAELDVVVGVASYHREMHAPKNLIQAAEEALAPQAARLK